MWSVCYQNAVGEKFEIAQESFAVANELAKCLRRTFPKVQLKKVGMPTRKWNVFLFDSHEGSPTIVAAEVSTRAAMMAWHRWDHRGHNAVLVNWPADVPAPATWQASAST